MTQQMIVGVNTAMFDGIDLETTFRTVHEAGFTVIELAYNQGYVGNLDPALFGSENAERVKELFGRYRLRSIALGCTINLAGADAVEQFRARIRFAHDIGATYLNTCTAKREDYARLVRNLRILAPEAADRGCVICVENGGDPNYDAFAVAREGRQLLEDVGHDAVAFNVDPGNMVSLRPDMAAIDQALEMLDGMRHCHIKDVRTVNGEFFFPAIGQGQLDYRPLLQALARRNIPCSLEIPLRMHRQADSWPLRADSPVPVEQSREVLLQSRRGLAALLGQRR